MLTPGSALDNPLVRRTPRTRTEEVALDLRERIASGELQPGERLASFKELGDHYAVGQTTINNAVHRLAQRGWLVTRRRSGVYVADMPPRTAAAATTLEQPIGPAPIPTSLDDFYRPVDAGDQQLRIYVSELLADNLALWQRLLGDFATTHPLVKLTQKTCLDGHFQPLHAQAPFDVVETTSWVLSACGFPAHDRLTLATAGCRAADLIPVARQWQEQSQARIGIPFLVTLSYLYVNLDLLDAIGMEARAPEGGVALLAMGAEADRRLQARGLPQRGMELASLHDLLLLEGACRWEHGQLIVSRKRLRRCLDAALACPIPVADSCHNNERFIAGKLALMHHSSYLAVDIRARARFRWAMLPLIQPDGLPLPARLTVLAMYAGCQAPTAAFALVRHLMSEPVQMALACQYGNVPVLASAALDERLCCVHPAGDAYRRMLANSTCLFPDETLGKLSRCSTMTFLTEGGTPSLETAAKRLEFSLSIGFGERLSLQ